SKVRSAVLPELVSGELVDMKIY
ncbi:MAG: hypothetical protein JWP67_157, partial [Mucilaginibacter sp.]|nr:hypothetical protein [Mucilaginibacter sp.]